MLYVIYFLFTFASFVSVANRCIPRNLSGNANDLLDNVFWKGSLFDTDKKFSSVVEGVQYLSRFVKIQEVISQ